MNEIEAVIKTAKLKPRIILGLVMIIVASLIFGESDAYTTSFKYKFNVPGMTNTFIPAPVGFSRAYDQTLAPLSVNFPDWFEQVKVKESTVDSGRVLVLSEQINDQYLKTPRYIPFEDYFIFKKSYNLDNMWYNRVALTDSTYFLDQLQEATGSGNSSLEIIGADIAGQRVALRIRGQISITGKYNQQNNSTLAVGNMSNEQKNFLMDQTQQFTIEGTIGDRVTISIDEDSERDFQFENAIKVNYKGKEDEIIQSANFGNIGLSLPGTQFVTGSSSSGGLFGGKAVMKFGPVDVTAIASYEKKDSKKKSWGGGSNDDGGSTIKIFAYEYKRNTYYFIDEVYRDDMYPLSTDNGVPIINHPENRIDICDLYVSCTETEANHYKSVAFVDIASNGTATAASEHPEEDVTAKIPFKKLKQSDPETNEYGDYSLDENLGYIKLNMGLADHQILAIAYKTADGRVYGDINNGEFLKVIKAENPKPSYATWDLEMKNIYDLKARAIDEEGFDLKILYAGENQPKEFDSKGVKYIQTFGLDNFNQSKEYGSDGVVDYNMSYVVNLSAGEVWLPYALPFQSSPEGDQSEGIYNPNLVDAEGSEKPSIEEIYELSYTDVERQNKDYYFEVSYSSRSSTIDLGEMFIIDGSEEILINGKLGKRGQDYDIDYFSGMITLKSASALDPDAKIDISYETEQLFGGIGEQKFMTGARAEYRINEKAFIGATAMYYSRSVLDDKNVNIGDEPFQNFIWDVNGEFEYDLNFLDRAINSLPHVRVKTPSQIKVSGEIAQILPNSNTIENEESGDYNGVAKLDDFESASQETPMNISFQKWTHASKPTNQFFTSSFSERGFMFWYNPFYVGSNDAKLFGILTTNIWPQKQTSESDQYTNVLNVVLDPNVNGITGLETQSDTRQVWGGIMQPVYMYDQSKSKYIELWVKGTKGQLQIDIGEISEDWYNENYDIDFPDTEYGDGEKNYEDQNNNSMLETSDSLNEDIGINGYTDAEEEARGWDPMIDNFDKEGYKDGSNLRYCNGTEGNAGTDGIQPYPETEDVDRDGKLDQNNSYYSYSLDLSSQEWYSSHTSFNNGQETGWVKYRIPLTAMVDSVGAPSFSSIRMMRLNVFGMEDQDTIQIADIAIVGNEWQEIGIAGEDSDIFEKDDERFKITVRNTDEDSDIYDSPPGISGRETVSNISGKVIREKEQSLVFDLNNLQPGETTLAEKIMLQSESLLMYKQLKMFVHGDKEITSEEARVNLFLRLGRGNMTEYYEAVTEVYDKWDDRNHIQMIFQEVTELKNRVSFDNIEYFSYEKGFIKEYRPIDPETGEYTGKIFRVVGNPTLSRIEKMQMGVINVSPDEYTGEIWTDELRVVESNNEAGMAMRGNLDLALGNWVKFNVNANKKDADFHQVNQQMSSSGSTSENLNMSMTVRAHEFFPASWRLSMPVTLSQRESAYTPKYFPGSDILVGENPADSLIKRTKSQSLTTSFGRSGNNKDPLLTRLIVNPVKVSATLSKSENSSLEILDQQDIRTSTKLSYNLSLPKGDGIKYMAWIPFLSKEAKEKKFYWKPSSFKWNLSLNENDKEWITRATQDTSSSYSFTLNKSMAFAYKPFNSLNINYNRSSKSDLFDYQEDKTRIFEDIAYDSLMNGINVGYVTGVNESFAVAYNPELAKWLKPNLKYNTSYRYSSPKGKFYANVGVTRKYSGRVSISLKNIWDTYEKEFEKMQSKRPQQQAPEKKERPKAKEMPRGADPDLTSGPGKAKQRNTNRRAPKKVTVSSILSKIDPISLNYTNDFTKGNSGITGSDTSKVYKNVTYKYRYGFVDYYTLPTGSFNSSIASPMKNSLKESFTISSGVKLGKMKIRLDYKQNTSTGRDYAYKTSSNEYFDEPVHIIVMGDTLELTPYDSSSSRNYVPMGEGGREGFVAPDYSLNFSITPSQIRWLNGKLDFIKRIAFSHRMSSRETIRYRQQTDEYPYYMSVNSANYQLNFSPLIKADFTFSGNTKLNFAFNKSIKYSHDGDSELDYLNTNITRNDQDNITLSMSYNYNKGLSIPVPFLKNVKVLNLNNDITFQLQGKYGYSKQMVKAKAELEFKVHNNNKINWEVEPRLSYKFSKNIDGQLFFKYGQRINLSQLTDDGPATDDYKDFGLTVTIRIRG